MAYEPVSVLGSKPYGLGSKLFIISVSVIRIQKKYYMETVYMQLNTDEEINAISTDELKAMMVLLKIVLVVQVS